MASQLLFASATEMARRVAAKDVSARELVDLHLARIESLDGRIGAFLMVDVEGARAQADAVDAAVAKGGELGPLAGVPIALKDVLVTRGLETTAASKILSGWRPPYDGTAVARLRAAGAVVLGKTNCDEFAMGSSNENSAFKVCRNPWDTQKVPGGSSGGSAAAVAAGMCAAALGTDTGGSIRQPASMCGVVGIKPTYGRVSRYGVIAFASSLDQVGPFARTVEDAALMLEVICGFDPLDSTSINQPAPRLREMIGRSIEGLTIGLPDEYFAPGTDPEVTAAVKTAIAALESAGAVAVPVSLPHTKYALAAYYLIAPAEASSNLARFDGIRYGPRANADGLLDTYRQTRSAGFGVEVKRRIMLGTFALRSGYYDAYYGQAQRVRTLIKRDFDRAFEKVDIIASPTSPTPAFAIGEKSDDPVSMYMSDVFTLSCNLAGLPGASIPCGRNSHGLPIGLQLLGKPLDEATVIKVAGAVEAASPVRDAHPEIAGD